MFVYDLLLLQSHSHSSFISPDLLVYLVVCLVVDITSHSLSHPFTLFIRLLSDRPTSFPTSLHVHPPQYSSTPNTQILTYPSTYLHLLFLHGLSQPKLDDHQCQYLPPPTRTRMSTVLVYLPLTCLLDDRLATRIRSNWFKFSLYIFSLSCIIHPTLSI